MSAIIEFIIDIFVSWFWRVALLGIAGFILGAVLASVFKLDVELMLIGGGVVGIVLGIIWHIASD